VTDSPGNVAIVDIYAPTRLLAPKFSELGYGCVRVQSTVEVPEVYRSSFDVDGFVANIVHRGSVEDTMREVAVHNPVAVLAGGELGVELADALSEGLGLASNGTMLSAARRDKFVMVETVGAAGLRAARQLRVGSVQELADWHRRVGGRLVVKPERSAGSDGVQFCESTFEAIGAYRKLLGRPNIFSEPHGSVVVQEYLVGAEYIVDTVSRAGRHHVCDIWRTVRADVNGVFDALAGFYIVPREGAVQDELVSYAFQVLDAVGIVHGPAHIEIKMTPEGPCLVEIGARIGGAEIPYFTELATGESQLNWTADAYVRPRRFDARRGRAYRIQQYVASVWMLSPYEGILRSYPYLSEIERLESLHDIRMMVSPGQPIARSVDDSTCPMVVDLRHPVEGVVMRDMATLRYLDGHAFYDIA
jgi:hypothetical protein